MQRVFSIIEYIHPRYIISCIFSVNHESRMKFGIKNAAPD